MAEVKWIQIATGIFDNRKIKQIERMPEGDAIIVVWLKLLCLAGTCNKNGLIYLTEEIPYTEEMLATEFGMEQPQRFNVLKLALRTFVSFHMIEIIDDVYFISSWEKYQNVEALDKIREQTRLRVAKHRESQRLIRKIETCQYCGAEATGEDRIIATARGGSNNGSNKVPCCIECNRIKNDKPLVDFLNNNRNRINDSIVTSNSKLMRHVYLCNVTDRYNVTQGNATDKEKEIDKDIYINNNVQQDCTNKISKTEIESFFESIWKMYPNKKGKGQVSDAKKKILFDLGFNKISTAINRYLDELNKDSWRKVQNGSTFFNSGYIDYLDENYHPSTDKPSNTPTKQNKFNSFPQRNYSTQDYLNLEKLLINQQH